MQTQYICPCCGFTSRFKNDMRRHLYKKRPCQNRIKEAQEANVVLTDAVKESILANGVYHIPKPAPVPKQIDTRINKLAQQLELLKVKKSEKFYQSILEEHLGGKHLAIPGIGTTDVPTDDMHVEIKEWKDWKAAIGQILAYNHGEKRAKLAIYLFGPKCERYPDAIKCIQSLGISAYELACDAIEQIVTVYSFAEGDIVYAKELK